MIVARRRLTVAGLVALALLPTAPARAELTAPAPPTLGAEPAVDWPRLEGLEAASWVLVEAATGQILAEHQGDEHRPVASIIKVLTALSVLDRADPDEVVVAGEEARDVEGASVGLTPGDQWTIEQLLDAIIIRSGNDAAEVLAAHVAGNADSFAALMAADATRLGLSDAVVVDPSGLTDDNLLSGRQVTTLGRAALADPRLRPLLARTTVRLPGLGEVETRNELLLTYPGATGIKTGFTRAAGNSLLGSAERDGRELIAVVLDAGEDPATRFTEVGQLLDLGFHAYTPRTVAGEIRYAVAGGAHVLEITATPVTTPTGEEPLLEYVPDIRPPDGPVDVEVTLDGRALGTVTAEAVDREPGSPEREVVEGGALLGRALVDGAYAGLRAASAAGALR